MSQEVVIQTFSRSLWVFFTPVLLLACCIAAGSESTVVLAFFIVLWIIYIGLRYYTDKVVITNQKINVTVGVIMKDTMSIPLNRINNIGYSQGLFGRIFGYGTVDFRSVGGVKFADLEKPSCFKEVLEKAVEQREQELRKQ